VCEVGYPADNKNYADSESPGAGKMNIPDLVGSFTLLVSGADQKLMTEKCCHVAQDVVS